MLPVYEIRSSDLTVKHNNYELAYPEHMHKFVEIVYVYHGKQHIKIDNIEYCVEEGCAAVVFPDTVHSYEKKENQAKKEPEYLILMVEPKIFGKLFPDFSKLRATEPLVLSDKIDEKLKIAFECISPNQTFEVQFSWACVIMSYLMEVLSLEEEINTPVSDISYKLIKYVEENFTEQISRATLAKHFNVSECYISRIFTQKFKMNLRNYLGIVRAEYAASMIRTTNESFTLISQLSGFDSQRTFNRVFRGVYGCTPNEYKKNINRFIKES